MAGMSPYTVCEIIAIIISNACFMRIPHHCDIASKNMHIALWIVPIGKYAHMHSQYWPWADLAVETLHIILVHVVKS